MEKLKKGPGVSLNMTVRYKEDSTTSVVNKTEKSLLVEDLQICNTPREYFFGNKPNPASEFLELSLLTHTNAKVFRTEIDTK